MTNEEAVNLSQLLTKIEAAHYNNEKINLPSKVIYAITRSILGIKHVVFEYDEENKTGLKLFKKEVNFDEEKAAKDKVYLAKMNESFSVFMSKSEERKQWLGLESDIKIHKFSPEEIDNVILPSQDIIELEKYLVQ